MIIKIKGGLGNQLFQYAYGRSLYFSGKKIIFDISFFKSNKKDIAREFKLNNFNISKDINFENKENVLFNFFLKLKRKSGFAVDEYFQNEKYFKNIEEIIRREFTLKNEIGKCAKQVEEEILNSKNSVSLHIRRGDYIDDLKTNSYHGTCNLDYYNRAVEFLKEKLGGINIFVFSDDIDWVKNNLKLYNVVFVSNSDIKDYEEVILMSKCQNNIIANSTFSWWGAWLNTNKNKIVIAPKVWFNNKEADEKNEIVLKNWIKM